MLKKAECEVCGCTEERACLGGCGWSKKYLERNRLVCTNCETKAS